MDECEAALNDYIDCLKQSLVDPGGPGSVEGYRALSKCRAALLAHCDSHGCGESVIARAAGA